MRFKLLWYLALLTLTSTYAKSYHKKANKKAGHGHKRHGLTHHKRIGSNTTTELEDDSGTKRTWECHKGCQQFCLPSCKKSCCRPGARDYSPSMTAAIEKFQGEMKGVVDQRMEIDEDTDAVQPFACGQFCSPECSPACTIGCCTEMVPRDDTNTPKHGGYQVAPVMKVMMQKPDKEEPPIAPPPKVADIQKLLEMPCGEYCSLHCAPACTPECCNDYAPKSKTSNATSRHSIGRKRQNAMEMYRKAVSTCHVDCEKLCLPACEFVCCVPQKMREVRFTKEYEVQFGLRKSLD